VSGIIPCQQCGGEGKLDAGPCPNCEGSGNEPCDNCGEAPATEYDVERGRTFRLCGLCADEWKENDAA